MMRVLDLDLDFFLADCCPLADVGERPALEGHEPWPVEEVRRFLEENCGLSQKTPCPGALFETHDGSLRFWDRLLREGRLTAPFEVVHVDAHSDLGIGRPGPGFVLQNVLSQRPQKRADLGRYYDAVQLDEANYLLFALAFRWIGRLENVRNPRSRPDIPQQIAQRGAGGAYETLQLVSAVSRLFEPVNGPEPVVPFVVYDDWRAFSNEKPFDFVTAARSPRYAPAAEDALFDEIARYICPVSGAKSGMPSVGQNDRIKSDGK